MFENLRSLKTHGFLHHYCLWRRPLRVIQRTNSWVCDKTCDGQNSKKVFPNLKSFSYLENNWFNICKYFPTPFLNEFLTKMEPNQIRHVVKYDKARKKYSVTTQVASYSNGVEKTALLKRLRNNFTTFKQNSKAFSFGYMTLSPRRIDKAFLSTRVEQYLFSNQSSSYSTLETNYNEATLAKNLYQRKPPNTCTTVNAIGTLRAPRQFSTTTNPENKKSSENIPSLNDMEKEANEESSDLVDPPKVAISHSSGTLGKHLNSQPKNVLNNVYDTVARELNNIELKLHPSYTAVREKKGLSSWCCTYIVKWPEPMKFVFVAPTKREASHKAALLALQWLKKIERITKEGQPIILDKQSVNKIKAVNIPKLSLDNYTVGKLGSILNTHNKEFVPLLVNNLADRENNNLPEEDSEMATLSDTKDLRFRRQRFMNPKKYNAKEKIELPISAYK